MSNVSVRLIPEKEPDETLALMLETVLDGESSGEGGFFLGSLPAGTFELRASHPEQPRITTDAFTLEEGQVVNGMVISLPAGAVIRGGDRGPGPCSFLSAEERFRSGAASTASNCQPNRGTHPLAARQIQAPDPLPRD